LKLAIVASHLGKCFSLPRPWSRFWQEAPRRVALEDVQFELPWGKCLAVLGPNGAGKTTLLRICAGLLTPSSGDAVVFGASARDAPEQVRRAVGFSNETHGFYPRLTGRQNLRFFASLQKVSAEAARERSKRWLEQLGLADAADVPVSAYSQGMKQRLSLARAAIHDPLLLLLDEPTRSLDAEMTAIMRRWLRGEWIERQGKSLVVATHSLDEAAEVADWALVLDHGCVRWFDYAAALTLSFESRFFTEVA
jgi:ABC-2 type transport system ATP-binding protein